MTKRRRRRWPRRIAVGFAAFLLLLFLLWVFRFPLFGGLLKDTIATALESEGIVLSVGEIHGTLLADAELRDVAIVDSRGLPVIREAELDRVAVSFSLFGLLSGRDDWIRSVEIEGLSGVIDLDAPPGPDRPEPPPSEGGGTTPLPGRVRISGVDLEVRNGEDVLQIAGGRLSADRGEGLTYRGSFGADLARTVVEDLERRAENVSAEFSLEDLVVLVEPLRMNGEDYGRVLRADLAGLEEDRIDLAVDLPLFGGRLRVDANADLSGEHPKGSADVEIVDLDPRPVLRFLPGVPVDLSRLSGTIRATADGTAPPGLEALEGSYDLTFTDPAYEGRRAGGLVLRGTLEGGTFDSTGRISDPDVEFRGRAAVTGETVRIDASADLAGFDLSRLSLAPEGREIAGRATVRATAEGPVDQLALFADVTVESPRFGEYGADSLEVRAEGSTEDFRIERVELRRGEDLLRVTEGRLRIDREPVAFSGTVLAEVATLAPYRSWLPADVPPGADGRIRIDVTADGTADAPGAQAGIRIEDATYDDLGARVVTVSAEIPTMERILVSELRVEGRGELPELVVTGAEFDFGPDLLGITVGGLRAVRQDLRLESRGALRIEIGDGSVRVSAPLHSSGVGVTVDGGVHPDDGLSGTVRIGEADLAVLSRVFDLPVGLEGSATGEIRLAGSTDAPDIELDLDVPRLAATPPGHPAIRTGPLRLRAAWRDGLARLTELSLEGPGGNDPWRLVVSGAVPLDPDDTSAVGTAALENGRIEIRGLPLDAAGPLPGIRRASGRLEASLALGGTAAEPTASGTIDVRADEIALEGGEVPPIGKVEVRLRLEELSPSSGQIRLERLVASLPGADVEASGGVTNLDGGLSDPEISLEVRAPEIGRVFEGLGMEAPVTGAVNVSVDVTKEPEIRVSVEGRRLARPGLLPLEIDLAGVWRNDVFRFEKGEVRGAAGRIEFGGEAPLPIDLMTFAVDFDETASPRLYLRPDVDLTALPTGSLRASGRVRGALRTAGTFAEPDVRGQLNLANVFLRSPGAPPVDDLNGAIVFGESVVEIRQFRGELGRGTLRIDGTVAREGYEARSAELRIAGTDLLVVRDRGTRLRTDLDCLLEGSIPNGLRLSGDVRIRSLRYVANVDYLTTEPSLAPLPLTEDPVLSALELNLVVTAPRESILVLTNVLEGELEGRIEVGGTLAVPRPDGRIRIRDGVAKLPTATMDIDQGGIEFRESEPLRPFVDARLATTVSGTEIRLSVEGPANGLRISFSSTPPLPEPDVLSILLTGVPRSQLGAETVGSVAATLLYRQLTTRVSDNRGEDSTLEKIVKRVDVEVDTSRSGTGGVPAWAATVTLVDDWLLLRGGQDGPDDYGLDLIWRLSFK